MNLTRQGQTIDQYRLIKPLGQGADSEVFLAVDTHTRRQVSLKILMDPESTNATARFERATVLWQRLNHPNIAGVYGSGVTADGCPYLVLEYVQGCSIEDIIEQEAPLDLERAMRLFRQLMLAVRVAHRQDTLHRDIKPTNILVTHAPTQDPRHAAREQVKLIDFGLARTLKDGKERVISGMTVTMAGHVVGTPLYMAPEQITTEGARVQSDLYAAALVFYEMLTGHSPIPGAVLEEILCAHLLPGPTIKPDDPLLPDLFGPVLARATTRAVDARYPTAEALLDALEHAFRGEPEPLDGAHAQPQPPRPKHTIRTSDTELPLPLNVYSSASTMADVDSSEMALAGAQTPDDTSYDSLISMETNVDQSVALPMLDDENPYALPTDRHRAHGGAHKPTPTPGRQTPLPIPETSGPPLELTPIRGETAPLGSKRLTPAEPSAGPGWLSNILRTLIALCLFYGATLAFLWLAQDTLLFRSYLVDKPAKRKLIGTLKWRSTRITLSKGIALQGYYGAPIGKAPIGTLLYLHGLDASPEVEAARLDPLRKRGLHVFVFGQRGYGGSEGSSDGDSFHQDALVAYDHVIGTMGLKPFRVYVHGRGVGGASAAAFVAGERPVTGVILEGATPDFARRLSQALPVVPFELLLHRNFNLDGLQKQRAPLLILHGKDDLVAPLADMQPVYNGYKGQRMLRDVKGGGHSDLPEVMKDDYNRAIIGFINAFGPTR